MKIQSNTIMHLYPLVRVLQGAIIKLRPTSLNISTGYLPFLAPGEQRGATILRIWGALCISDLWDAGSGRPSLSLVGRRAYIYDPRPQLKRRHSSSVLQKQSYHSKEEPVPPKDRMVLVFDFGCCFTSTPSSHGELLAHSCRQHSGGVCVSMAKNRRGDRRGHKTSRNQKRTDHGYQHTFHKNCYLRNRSLLPFHACYATCLQHSRLNGYQVLLE